MKRQILAISVMAAALLHDGLQSARGGTIVEALSYALEAAQPAVKEGFTVREERWGGDLAAGQPLPIPHQLFKGNDYWFWMGTDSKGATISVHIYDKNGKLVEDEFWQKGQKAAAKIRPKRTGTYYLLVEVEKSTEERTVWSLAYGFR
ncbi:MAG: hypothetical protein EBR81_00940 [Proteobacteria bacterium]|nr:hypothetical protein [Pseudomonadota bacterium]